MCVCSEKRTKKIPMNYHFLAPKKSPPLPLPCHLFFISSSSIESRSKKRVKNLLFFGGNAMTMGKGKGGKKTRVSFICSHTFILGVIPPFFPPFSLSLSLSSAVPSCVLLLQQCSGSGTTCALSSSSSSSSLLLFSGSNSFGGVFFLFFLFCLVQNI